MLPDINPTKLLLGIAAPFIAAGSAWLATAVGRYGVHLDPSGVNALGVAGVTVAGGIMAKLIHDVEAKPQVAKVFTNVDSAEKSDPALKTVADDFVTEAESAVEHEASSLVSAWPPEPETVTSSMPPVMGPTTPTQ